MPVVDEVERARLNKITDNTKIKPVELLKMLIDDIERGEVVVDGLVIVTALRPEKGAWTYSRYRCNMSNDQEVLTLTMGKAQAINHWMNK